MKVANVVIPSPFLLQLTELLMVIEYELLFLSTFKIINYDIPL